MTQANDATRFLNPSTMPQPAGYTQVVDVTGGRTIYIAGQIALDAEGQVVGSDDLHAQTVQIFENIGAALTAVDATFQHVVKLNYYLLDISQIMVVRGVRDRYINTEQPPASTAVEVRRLFRDDFLIEIEAIAVLPG